jgi:hypothetical protein
MTCSYPELECKALASRLNLCLPTYLQHFRAGGGEVGGTEVDAGGGAEPRLLSAYGQECNAANERQCAYDGWQRDVVCLVARSVNRPDVDDLFPSGVGKTSPHKTDQTKHNQDSAKRFHHGSLLLLFEDGFNLV